MNGRLLALTYGGALAVLLGLLTSRWAWQQDNPFTPWSEVPTGPLVLGLLAAVLGVLAVLAALIGYAVQRR